MDLRNIWLSEPQDFTPWLAQDGNLKILGDALGIELELEAQEKNVGPFRADILCRSLDDDSLVLIENQLEKTDHIHLGQLLTYAAGLQSVTSVWIAATFTEEHRAALDWLNQVTNESVRFFGLEIELWQIDESVPAPKFNVVSKPNDWSRRVSQAARQMNDQPATEGKALQLKFWAAFAGHLKEQKSPVRPQAPRSQHWMTFGIGRTGFNMHGLLNTREDRIGVEVTMTDANAKDYFNALRAEKDSIEDAFGDSLEWLELPEKKQARIARYKEDCDLYTENRWPEYMAWMRERLEKLDKVFRQRIKGVGKNHETEL
ncbi:DUF4268 domain-containing protein [Acidithiobacillus ferrooxidans]|uniref:DUF4268 domain-containing protein n=1 Tax=Acidithiobacillus ferrooxidans TaxID=920 RepID=UPI00214C4F4E|nr:DUF4268 domain-containing protein [Acidithiobacillus ferrooxidans]MCR2830802.1 DUF4268 domain-containing protein [Acidithiobacillus ferrooxidans]